MVIRFSAKITSFIHHKYETDIIISIHEVENQILEEVLGSSEAIVGRIVPPKDVSFCPVSRKFTE